MTTTKEPEKVAAPADGSQAAKDQGQRFNEVADKVRQRAESAAKALGGLGTTALTAVGIAKFGDIFPLPNGAGLTAAAVIAGFLLMTVAVYIFFRRLSKVYEPVIWRSDLDLVTDLRRGERDLVEPSFQEMEELNEVPSLRAYEARALRLERIGARLSDKELAADLESQSARIRAEVSAILARANLRVVRHRSSKALTGFWAFGSYVLFIIGLLGFAIGADYLQSERSDKIALAKSCAEARTADALEAELPSICGEVTDSEPDPKQSAEQQRAESVEQLATDLSDCQMLIDTGAVSDPQACDPLKRAITALMSEQ